MQRVRNLRLKLKRLLAEQCGQDLIEYILLVSLIALAAISGVNKVATSVTPLFTNVSTSLASQQHPTD